MPQCQCDLFSRSTISLHVGGQSMSKAVRANAGSTWKNFSPVVSKRFTQSSQIILEPRWKNLPPRLRNKELKCGTAVSYDQAPKWLPMPIVDFCALDCEPNGRLISTHFNLDTFFQFFRTTPSHGQRIVILLCGGAKKTQNADIKTAKTYWADWKRRQP